MVVWAIADRLLDLIGLGTLIYLTVKGTTWINRKWSARK